MAKNRRDPKDLDAYRFPRHVAEGCQHRLGCRCDVPFWLREPTVREAARFLPEQPISSAAGQ